MTEEFDFDKALKAQQSGQAITDKDGVLTPLIKQLTEAALEVELDSHLAQEVAANGKNGKTSKRMKSTAGRIAHEVQDSYGISVSTATLSAITDKIIG